MCVCLCRTGILGVTYRLAQGVVKHIIPAVASTNAVVAAACALEVFKLASSCAPRLDNYMVFNDTDGECRPIDPIRQLSLSRPRSPSLSLALFLHLSADRAIFPSPAGIYTYAYAAERNENCVACSQIPKEVAFAESARLAEVMAHLAATYQMKGPGVTTTDERGRNRTLYLPSVASIEERTRPNLKKTLKGN